VADLAHSYDALASHYHLIFENWEASIGRQATVLAEILNRECGEGQIIRVLDCACGIGTQSLGLAMKGFDVRGCDISPGAVQRAKSEAVKRGLGVQFSVANILQLTAVEGSSYEAVICIDNSLPHLESDEQLLQAARQAHAKLRAGGVFVGSIRDYDHLILERPVIQGPNFYADSSGRRIVFQVWDWLDERRYRFHLYITRSTESTWQTFHFTSTYRAVLRNELLDIFVQGGFTDVEWLLPSSSGFYQPILVARRKG
jgi:SAM-dependent methyltransferase